MITAIKSILTSLSPGSSDYKQLSSVQTSLQSVLSLLQGRILKRNAGKTGCQSRCLYGNFTAIFLIQQYKTTGAATTT